MKNKELLIKKYKAWAEQYISYYGDFDSVDDLVFEERDGYIFVGHPEDAEDYGEGECGGVNGSIQSLKDTFSCGSFQTIPLGKDYWTISRKQLKELAEEYGLELETHRSEAVVKIKGLDSFEGCSTTDAIHYLNFFENLNEFNKMDMDFTYFTFAIPGNDDYWGIATIEFEDYLFWITRYNPNF